MFKKKNPIDQRKRRIERELELVESDLKALSGAMESDPVKADSVRLRSEHSENDDVRNEQHPSSESHSHNQPESNELFSSYLTGEFQSVGPLKNERKLQRNKAIAMLIVLGLILIFLLGKYL